MPLTPDHARSFLCALSDFWTIYVRDRDTLRGYAEGIEVNAAQLYQRLLETALSTSLSDVPIFSRDFYRPYFVREDLVRYREGASTDEDTYIFATGDALASAAFLANRVLAPTEVLQAPRDFVAHGGEIAFRDDPFAGVLAHFPERSVAVVAPAAWVDPLARTWGDARPGDALRTYIGGSACEAHITGVEGAIAYLDAAPPALRTPLAQRGGRAYVLRTPYDETIAGALLPDHPTACARLSRDATDGVTVAASGGIDVSGVGTYHGTWNSSTDYEAGDLVWASSRVWQALVTHGAMGSFDATLWDDLTTGFFYLTVPDAPRFDGLYGGSVPGSLGQVCLQGLSFDSASTVRLHRVRYAATDGLVRPSLRLGHRHLTPSSVEVSARRSVDRTIVDETGAATTYPAFAAVIEGVDYTVDAETGIVIPLSAWDPLRPARISYRWRLEVAARPHAWVGAYGTGRPYGTGDVLSYAGALYIVTRDHTSDGTVDADRYAPFVEPVRFDAARTVREVSVWATDALLDEDTLYRNFGHLLGSRRPSSEAQRSFLQAVSRLFLQGPSFPLIESALTAVAGLPLVREEGELLVSYDDGIAASGTGARLYDTMQGTDGALDPGTSRFSAASAEFQATDVGTTLRVVVGGATRAYTITTYVSASVVGVAPTPGDTASGLGWEARHGALTNRLRIDASEPSRFTQEHVGAWVRLRGRAARNRGVFQVVAVDDPLTVELDTAYGFLDESSVSWDLSPRGVQVVRTDRRDYEVPLGVPIRTDVSNPANARRLALHAFAPVTAAFQVVDYLTDPAWWHRVQIPEELFSAPAATRTVTPALIEHVYGALDEPREGDPGLFYGADDDGVVPGERPCVATWYGGAEVVLAFAGGVPTLRSRDAGAHLVVTTPGFAGHFPISRVHADGATVTLERFPPPEARGGPPAVTLDAELPPILLRHAVAYVLMDRLLKYHCMQVRMDPSITIPRDVIGEMARLVATTRPSHIYVFFEAGTRFEDAVAVSETFSLHLDRGLYDPVYLVDASAIYAQTGLLRYGDAYRFVTRTTTLSLTPGVAASLPTTLPAGTDVVRTLVRVGFPTASRVGARLPCEGVDYDVDYVAGTVTLRAGVVLTPDPVAISYVDCIRRIISPGDPLDAGETAVVYGGADPTVVRAPGQDPRDAGFLDRAIQLTFGT